MFRLIYYLVLTVIVISVIQGIIRVFRAFFRALMSPPARPAAGPGAGIPVAGELKRDPVCGTFIATSSSLKLSDGGGVRHFCSAECRDKFLAAAAHR